MKNKVTKTDVFVAHFGVIVAYIVIGSAVVGCLGVLVVLIRAMFTP
jgi:hypothetical protein